jgi:SAM-dependent methyltransferase
MIEKRRIIGEEELAAHFRAVSENDDMPHSRGLSESGSDPRILSFLSGLNPTEIFKKGYLLLELGCGAGNTLVYLARKYGVVPHGIDLKKRVPPEANIGYTNGNIEDMCHLGNNQFDVVFSNGTFHYTPDKLQALREAHRVLRLSGIGIIDFSNLVVDDDGSSTPELVDETVVPTLQRIIAAYPNQGQVACSRVNIYDRNGRQERRSNRVIIKKVSEDPLSFPKPASTEYFRPDLPFVRTTYIL